MPNLLRRNLALTLILLTLAAGCATSGPKPALHLLPDPKVLAKGSIVGKDVVHIQPEMVVAVRVIDKEGAAATTPFFKRLIEGDYVIFKLDFTNLSKDKMTFNPSYAVLMDSTMGYAKPLDYTSLYSLALRVDMEKGLSREIKGSFYDSNETVKPGETVSKLLVFAPISARAKKAKLVLKMIYVGTDNYHIAFPFVKR